MLIGAHAILYSKNAEADRAFLRDVLRLSNVDAGGGWLIFAPPTSEVAIHPADNEAKHELHLMCADISDFIEVMREHEIEYGPVSHERWGLLTQLQLPGGGQLGVYEPRHPRPKPLSGRKVRKRSGEEGNSALANEQTQNERKKEIAAALSPFGRGVKNRVSHGSLRCPDAGPWAGPSVAIDPFFGNSHGARGSRHSEQCGVNDSNFSPVTQRVPGEGLPAHKTVFDQIADSLCCLGSRWNTSLPTVH
jgi:hypothetical protein